MYKIVICDSSVESLNQTEAHLNAYFMNSELADYEICRFESGLDLMNSVESGMHYDLFILEVLMPGLNGVGIARELRNMGFVSPLIFITTVKDYALDAFSVGATQYLIKGFSTSQFNSAMDMAINILSRERRRQIILSTTEGYKHVCLRSIIYAEGHGNYQHINLEDGSVLQVRITHTALMKLFEKYTDFVGCGSSYIVNIFFISFLKNDMIDLKNGESIPIPRGAFSKVKQAYFDFYGEE